MPPEHWRSIRTNNPLEKADAGGAATNAGGGSLSDGRSALMLVAARLRHGAATCWGSKRYLQMNRLTEVVAVASAKQPQPTAFPCHS